MRRPHGVRTISTVERLSRAILALFAAILLTGGSGALRALHVAAEHGGADHPTLAHADHADDGACDGHPHHGHDDATHGDDHVPGGDSHCDTCDLLVALVGMTGGSVPVPTFHALVAVEDAGTPSVLPAPVPLRTLAARPPPAC